MAAELECLVVPTEFPRLAWRPDESLPTTSVEPWSAMTNQCCSKVHTMGLSGAWLLSRASKALMPLKSNGLPVSRKPSPCTLIERFLFQRWSHVCEQRSSRHRQEITSYKTLNIFEYVKEVQAGRSSRDFSNAGLTSIDQFTSRHRVEHSRFNWAQERRQNHAGHVASSGQV